MLDRPMEKPNQATDSCELCRETHRKAKKLGIAVNYVEKPIEKPNQAKDSCEVCR